MVNITDKTQCTGCTACASVCAHNAITMRFDEYGHSYPVVNTDTCTDCRLCERVCPLLHRDILPTDKEGYDDLLIYAAYNKDSDVRSKSTSGGIFTLLAQYVISLGGCVYAARFDDEYRIYHSSFDSMDDIDSYRGSKYAQSDLGTVFRNIKKDLKTKPVLFVGSPCQVAGLKGYLRNEYPNLFTCDFICMCIASPVIWREYLNDYWNVKDIKRIWFKDKRIGWHNWRMLIEDSKGEHLVKGNEDPFFSSYLSHLISRPSCNKCAFRSLHHISDFTIADCWGIDQEKPSFDDDKGCTTIILQTAKAVTVFDTISSNIEYTKYPSYRVIKHNPYSKSDFSPNADVKMFYKYYRDKGLRYAFDSVKKSKQKGLKSHIRLFFQFINKLFKRYL